MENKFLEPEHNHEGTESRVSDYNIHDMQEAEHILDKSRLRDYLARLNLFIRENIFKLPFSI